MRGVVTGGVYRAAIGSRAVLRGEQIGREMGMSTWISVAGTNDHALVQGEFVETPDGLTTLLKALRARGVDIVSIRNHTLGEHNQCIFVRFWGQDNALELAKKIRYVLDTQVGNIAPNPTGKDMRGQFRGRAFSVPGCSKARIGAGSNSGLCGL